MKTIGVLGAMPDEIKLVYSRLTNHKEEKLGGCTFYDGTLGDKRVVLVCAGMGKANAAAATQLLCSHFGCEGVVFSGIAGNMTGKIGVGDVVIGGTVEYHDAENRMIAESYPHLQQYVSDAAMVAAAENACRAAGVRYLVGKIATGDQFVGDTATKNAIAAKCSPDCVEMEGAAVAQIAAKNDVPFVILRAMSDDADENAYETLVGKPFDISEYCTAAAQICTNLIASL